MADPNASQNQTTVIGPDTFIKGEMSFDNTARLLGRFEGKISAKGELQVAEGATCNAAVEASRVTVDGSVEGDMIARERVALNAKSSMKGDLVAAKLAVAEGAVYVGHVTVGPDAAKASGKPGGVAEAKPQPTKAEPTKS